MSAPTTNTLAHAREQAAEDLQLAIEAAGGAYRAYQAATQQLGDRVGADLAMRLEVPIVLHLARAGFSGFLERRLAGTPGSLRAIVATEHAREGLGQ